jgi:CitB family two-component system response regulator MalR
MIKTIIVEDDPMVAEFNRRYLEKIDGFELVGMFSTVENAFPIIEKQPIDLILLDIYMPVENGWSLLSKIRALGKGIDVILITAACDKQSIKKGLRYGVVDYLIKPFEFDRFEAALTSYKEGLSFLNEHEKISQSELDQIILHKEQRNEKAYHLPKGLTKTTLINVWRKLAEFQDCEFSTEEIAHEVGISRVSMRKYLNFLTDIHIVETDVVYGTIGRPIYMHRVANLDHKLIKKYIE